MEMINSSEPIFVVGMNGSGTTMLLDCLNNHDHLYGFMRETKLIPYYIKNLHKYGDLSIKENFLSLFNEFRNLSFFRYTNDGKAPPLPDNWEALDKNFASIVDSVFSYYSIRDGKKRWCEKTPMHAQHIDSLSDLFPRAQFIHIIRDGRSCSASFYRRWRYNPILTMYRWKNVVREARRQGKEVGDRYLEIRYEALTELPEKTMSKICEFLNVPYSESLLVLSRKRTSTGSTEKKIMPNKRSWKNILKKSQVKELDMIGGSLLDELGYDTDCPKSDKNPNWFLLKYMLSCNYIKRGIDELKRPKENKWDDLSAIIIRAIKQRLISKY